ncbi:hypothetical protein EJG51_015840 [Undibacterium piscinae]|uniref:YqjK-like protein n=1 Tax=Undibacterium piscinae TaxID=2495591 RepID=A0A6M4AB33_9BURK|nr:hypothetical protein EJG51_015840 [Undibacterium piscinae]
MSNLSEKLSLRRQTLLAKSQAERMLLTQHVTQIRQSLALADLGLQIAGKIKQRPAIAIGLIAASFVVKPKRMLPLLKTAVMAWQIWQNFAPAIKQIQSQPASGKPD